MVWKTVAGIVVGLAVCNLAVAFREVGRHKDKIWLHRCNSMEKLCEKEHRYPNVEVDLVFREDNTFDVTHDVGVSSWTTTSPTWVKPEGGCGWTSRT